MSGAVATQDIPFMDDRNTPRPAKKALTTCRAAAPTKKAPPPPRGGAGLQNGLSSAGKMAAAPPSARPASGKPGSASARAAMVSPPNSVPPPRKKSPEAPSEDPSNAKAGPAYTARNKSFRPKPRPPKQKAPEPPSEPVSPKTGPFKPKITAKKAASPKTDAPPTRNMTKPPRSFSVDPLDIARNYPMQPPKTSRSSNPISSTSVAPTTPPPLASPDGEFANMSLEIGPDLSPTFSFDRQMSSGEKLITFKDNLNPRTDFDQLSKLLANLLDDGEKQCMADLKQYLVKKEEAWILDLKLLNFVGGLLENRSLEPTIRVKVVRLLAAGALRDDFWSFLQLDRRDRQLMKYPNDFDELSVEEQKAVAMFLCNSFSSSKGADWLLYGSPWKANDDEETSNVQITSKVAAFSLVSYTPSLQDLGSAIIYNIALKEAKGLSVPVAQYTELGLPSLTLDYKEVSDTEIIQNGSKEHKFVTLKVYNDVALELCMACLKFIKKTQNPAEEILYRCVKSLLKFSLILKGDLLTCIAMVQCDLDTAVPGTSDRIDLVWAELRKQLINNSADDTN